VDVVGAALAVLPRQPTYVSIIDVEAQDDRRVRETLRSLEAFTLPGKDGVYVTLCGPTLQRAIETRDEKTYRFDVHVLGAILWHEMTHLEGADERAAQRSEEALWRRFVLDGRVDARPALEQTWLYASRRRHEGTRR
jgi:hypothetical protein